MARAAKIARLTDTLRAAVALAVLAGTLPAAYAQTDTQVPAVSKECGEIAGADGPLPNSARALRERQELKILAIGASSASMLGSSLESKPLLEKILERSIKGLNVEIINRGVSGELAADAAEPDAWTIEKVDKIPHAAGSPGIYADGISDVFFDNVKVYRNQ